MSNYAIRNKREHECNCHAEFYREERDAMHRDVIRAEKRADKLQSELEEMKSRVEYNGELVEKVKRERNELQAKLDEGNGLCNRCAFPVKYVDEMKRTGELEAQLDKLREKVKHQSRQLNFDKVEMVEIEGVKFERVRECHVVKNSRKYVLSNGDELFDDGCSICNGYVGEDENYCSNCGARVIGCGDD